MGKLNNLWNGFFEAQKKSLKRAARKKMLKIIKACAAWVGYGECIKK